MGAIYEYKITRLIVGYIGDGASFYYIKNRPLLEYINEKGDLGLFLIRSVYTCLKGMKVKVQYDYRPE